MKKITIAGIFIVLIVCLITVSNLSNNTNNNNIISGNAVCLPQWFCLNSRAEAYQNIHCAAVNISICNNGCSDGRCKVNNDYNTCQEHWLCLNPKTEAYRNTNCKITNTTFCRQGCIEGRCIASSDNNTCIAQWFCLNSKTEAYKNQDCKITNTTLCRLDCYNGRCNSNVITINNSNQNNNQTVNHSINNTEVTSNNSINGTKVGDSNNITNNSNSNNISNTSNISITNCNLSSTNNSMNCSSFANEQMNISKNNFTIIVIPDSQFEVQNYPEVFFNQMNWIVDNKETLNIQAVIHVGDMANVASNETQWQTVNEGIEKLDKINMPVILGLGNHDHPTTMYNKYFPISRYGNKTWWGGELGNNTDNKYVLLTIENLSYIIIGLDFCPNSDEISWANSILAKYPERKAILTTHAFLDKNGGRNPHVCTDTNYIWNDFIRHHENLQIVVSGHVHAESRRTDKNIAGNNVYQMLADFQEDAYGGNGWLRILTFSPSNNTIYVSTYSPFVNQSQDDNDSKFNLEYNLSSCEKENNCCIMDEDCSYIWFTGGCYTPEYVSKILKKAEEDGMYIGEAQPRENVTCTCESNKCVTHN